MSVLSDPHGVVSLTAASRTGPIPREANVVSLEVVGGWWHLCSVTHSACPGPPVSQGATATPYRDSREWLWASDGRGGVQPYRVVPMARLGHAVHLTQRTTLLGCGPQQHVPRQVCASPAPT